jgi:hypothetical protein
VEAALSPFVTHRELYEAMEFLKERIDKMAEISQADIDALTAQVQQVVSDLEAAKGNLQQELDNLSTANPSVDLTNLRAAVAPLDGAVNALNSLQPTPPAAAPPPPSPPAAATPTDPTAPAPS